MPGIRRRSLPERRRSTSSTGLYAEFLPNFTSGMLNIGCDETVELGQGRSRKLCAERGLHRVYLDFLSELVKLAGRHGRRVQFWGDIILHEPELIPELPQGVTALDWGYEANHPFRDECAKFRAAGIPFYVCPGTSAWNSITGRTANMFGNIGSAARCGRESGAAGLLLTDWGDGRASSVLAALLARHRRCGRVELERGFICGRGSAVRGRFCLQSGW